MTDSINIKLGEQEYPVRPFNIAQLKTISATLGRVFTPTASGLAALPGTALQGMIEIIQVALKRTNPQVKFEELEVSFPDIRAAFDAIMKLNGMETTPVGEGKAGSE